MTNCGHNSKEKKIMGLKASATGLLNCNIYNKYYINWIYTCKGIYFIETINETLIRLYPCKKNKRMHICQLTPGFQKSSANTTKRAAVKVIPVLAAFKERTATL